MKLLVIQIVGKGWTIAKNYLQDHHNGNSSITLLLRDLNCPTVLIYIMLFKVSVFSGYLLKVGSCD